MLQWISAHVFSAPVAAFVMSVLYTEIRWYQGYYHKHEWSEWSIGYHRQQVCNTRHCKRCPTVERTRAT